MSRNTPDSQLSLQRYWKVAALSGCIASLLFPIFPASYSIAATSDAGEIESTAPGIPSDSSPDDFPDSNPDGFPDSSPEGFPSETGPDESPAVEPNTNDPVTLEDVRFSCLNRGGEHTVMYQPESRPGEGFPWAIPTTLGGGWSAESRCFEIARRLEEYRPDGLVELKTGRENGYNILCVTTEDNPDCRIVLTVPPNQDPIATRNAVFDNLLVADTGEQTTGVVTYAGGAGDGITGELINAGSRLFGRRGTKKSDRGAVRLKPFLDRADGGSATALRNGVRLRNRKASPARGVRLSPDRFR